MRPLTTSVTALRFISIADGRAEEPFLILLAGIGNQVHVFENGADSATVADAILPDGERVHGFSQARGNQVIVHGGYYLKVVAITLSRSDRPASISVQGGKRCGDWIWGTYWTTLQGFFAIACGHSRVWICDSTDVDRTVCFESVERELTWSTTLFSSRCGRQLRAVAGTSFGDILLWNVMDGMNDQALAGNMRKDGTATTVEVRGTVKRLSGHDGPIMKLKVSTNAQVMASASVDRSVRVWKACNASCCPQCGGAGCFNIALVHYGHLARVWDVAFLEDGGLGVASVAEDRTCRIWSDSEAGTECAVFRGHSGRNVWSLDVQRESPELARICTGGEDGCIKLRSIPLSIAGDESERQPLSVSNAYVSSSCVSGSFLIPGRYGNPRKNGGTCNESGRTVVLVSEESVLVSTDYGRILVAHFGAFHHGDVGAVSWTELYRCDSGTAYTPSSLVLCNGLVVGGQTDGGVTVLQTSTESGRIVSAEKVLHIDAFLGKKAMVMGVFASTSLGGRGCTLFVATGTGDLYHWHVQISRNAAATATYVQTYVQKKPTKSAVVTSVLHLCGAGLVIVGDRGGRVLLYEAEEEGGGDETGATVQSECCEMKVKHPATICRPHTDRVSTIRSVDDIFRRDRNADVSSATSFNVMTAGFDGQMARHVVWVEEKRTWERRQVRVKTVSCQKTIEHVDTIGKLIFPRLLGHSVDAHGRSFGEGSEAKGDGGGRAYSREIAVGFRSAEVVVWDMQKRNEVFRANCGNWRRAYDVYLEASCEEEEEGGGRSKRLCVGALTFAFWRSGKLHVMRRIVETQQHAGSTGVQSIGVGFHGQRANALDWLPGTPQLLTASEDTTLCVTQLEAGQLRTTQTLSGHISGATSVCAMALADGSHAALSGGGSDQVVAWHAGRRGGGEPDARWCKVGQCRVGEHELQRVLCMAALGSCGGRCAHACGCAVGVCGRSDGSVGVVRAAPATADSGTEHFRGAGGEWDVQVAQLSRGSSGGGDGDGGGGGRCNGRGAVLCCAAAGGDVKGTTETVVVVVCGDSRGRVWVEAVRGRCAATRVTEVWACDAAHAGGVNAVDVRVVRGAALVTSGGDDGRVQVWRVEVVAVERSDTGGVRVVSGVRVTGATQVWRSAAWLYTAAVTGVCFARAEECCRIGRLGAAKAKATAKAKAKAEAEAEAEAGAVVVCSVGADQDVAFAELRWGSDGGATWQVCGVERRRTNIADASAIRALVGLRCGGRWDVEGGSGGCGASGGGRGSRGNVGNGGSDGSGGSGGICDGGGCDVIGGGGDGGGEDVVVAVRAAVAGGGLEVLTAEWKAGAATWGL